MKIQLNTDRTISADEKQHDYFTHQIAKELENFKAHITRIEAHISDENGKKEGSDATHCVLEARIEGRQPIAVSDQANSTKDAVVGALDKLKSSVESIIGRMQKH